MTIKRTLLALLLLVATLTRAQGQEFFNLTADEVRIDSLLPCFTHRVPLGANYADSTYEVSVLYPEFIDMSPSDIRRYGLITADTLPEMPAISSHIGVARKRGTLYLSFVPLVKRDGKMQKLVSFMLQVTARPVAQARKAEADPQSRYADHSVLSNGTWAKIRVSQTGVYQLTDAFLRSAGFSHPDKVRVYGYGGAMQPERLTADYLQQTDDLPEVATCTIGGKRLMHAVGPVNWNSATDANRVRNPYSQYGYYFLTESDEAPLTVDSAAFFHSFYPSPNDYHALYEVDDYAWFHGGRKLYDGKLFGPGVSHKYTLPAYADTGRLTVSLSYDGPFEASVLLGDSVVGKVSSSQRLDEYSSGTENRWTFNLVGSLKAENNITIRQNSGANLRLDYLVLSTNEPKPLDQVGSTTYPTPEYCYHITNQDLHGHEATDMLIVIPTSQKWRSEAERLKTLHEAGDSLRVRILPADELYNEFSSGTPDANAIRRYLKMLYDRAQTDADMPRYLLLMADGVWDNRMLTSDCKSLSPDDYLLCYESDNSFSETKCYVSDDYFCLLDDGEGANMLTSDKADVAVGRLIVRSSAEAKAQVDKIVSYHSNELAGPWQNTLCFMADDGNNNRHMNDAERVIETVLKYNSGYQIKKIYWDAYTRVSSATGHTYPDVTRLIKQQMRDGALVMNYTGHGAAYTVSHEMVLYRTDFEAPTSLRLPLWITASCDIMPFDSQIDCIGESAMLNKNGGAIAFFGTTRTVYANYNQYMNKAFMRFLLGYDEAGNRISIGEAARLAKNDLVTRETGNSRKELDLTENKLQYTLLGDPALILAAPTLAAHIDSINGESVAEGPVKQLQAGSIVTVKGSVDGPADFCGRATITVKDVEETVVCRLNSSADTDSAFQFRDRQGTIYTGSDSIVNGRFTFHFAVPKDISYSDATGLMLIYGVNNEKTLAAHGEEGRFSMNGDAGSKGDGVGPSIYCYLNSSAFSNGDKVNATPYFYAELKDKDGINAAGNGIGHDLELVIDGDMLKTYNLNSFFQYNFGDYSSGTVGYSIPKLEAGPHKLQFRAWDVLNNSSTAELSFVVDPNLEPSIISVICEQNNERHNTRFIIVHDRTGSEMDVTLEIFDPSGRKLWERAESGLPTDQTYVVDWDMTVSGGHRLRTGVYFYRVLVSSGGSRQATKARKLIVINNN